MHHDVAAGFGESRRPRKREQDDQQSASPYTSHAGMIAWAGWGSRR
jgi:hypothetical protein